MEETRKDESEYTISILDIFIFILKHIKILIIIPLISSCTIIILLYMSTVLPHDSPYNLFPNFYKPEAEVLISSGSSNNMSAAMSQASNIPGLGNLFGSTSNSNLELAKTFLQGKTISDQIINEFNFIEIYNIEKMPLTTARSIFKNSLDIEETDGTVIISYKNADPVLATKIVNKLVVLLEERFQNFSQNKIVNKRSFLEDRLEQINLELKNAQKHLIEFQNEYGISNIEMQTKFYTEQIFALKSSIIANELEKQRLLEYTMEDDPRIIQIENQKDIYNRLIEEFQTGFNEFAIKDIPPQQLQQLTNKYYDIRRELEIQDTLYTFLKQQYETTKIEEADNTKTIQIIEMAEEPEVQFGPQRSLIAIIVFGASIFIAFIIAFLFELKDSMLKDPVEQEKLTRIKKYLPFKKNKPTVDTPQVKK